MKHRGFNVKMLVPLFILVIGLMYSIWYYFLQNEQPNPVACTLESFVDNGWVDSHEAVILAQDYFVYGENISFFHEPYRLDVRDTFVGRTIRLINLCTSEIRDYLVQDTVDGQIPMDDLPVGVYALQISIDLERLQLASTLPIDSTYTTINRKEHTRSIRLFAQPTHEDIVAPLFLEVKPITLSEEVYDVVIDPGHRHADFGSLDLGVRAFGLIEAEENHRLAVALQRELEALGLNVLVTRDAQETVNIYGVGGRMFMAYASQAKYYIEIQMVANTNPNVQGTQVVHSSFASSRLGSAIHRSLIENTSLLSTNNRGRGNIQGVIPASLARGMDNQMYDSRFTLRETGGKALGAAQFSEFSNTRNATFAYHNPRGVHALIIEIIHLTHEPSAQAWLNEYERYAREIARGFADYLQLP